MATRPQTGRPPAAKIAVMRSQLGRARGAGAAHAGSHHWKAERITALALIPLSLWFIIAALSHLGADQPAIAAWAGRPLNAALLLALIAMNFHHMHLGLQVVWEDYIHNIGRREAAILVTRGACLLLGLLAAVSVLKLAAVAH
jgi:succinate dehydrogenase / fumarate reductase membrane anchor subunit